MKQVEKRYTLYSIHCSLQSVCHCPSAVPASNFSFFSSFPSYYLTSPPCVCVTLSSPSHSLELKTTTKQKYDSSHTHTHTQPLIHVNGGFVGCLRVENADMHQSTASERRPAPPLTPPSLSLPHPSFFLPSFFFPALPLFSPCSNFFFTLPFLNFFLLSCFLCPSFLLLPILLLVVFIPCSSSLHLPLLLTPPVVSLYFCRLLSHPCSFIYSHFSFPPLPPLTGSPLSPLLCSSFSSSPLY